MRSAFLSILVILLQSCGQSSNNSTGSNTEQKDAAGITAPVSPVSGSDSSSTKTSAAIGRIRDEYNRINTTQLTQKKITFECDIEGTATYYFENNKVVRIVIEDGFAGDNSTTSQYYFKDGKLMFIYEVHLGGSATGPDTRKEERTYVQDNKVIKYMEYQNEAPCTTCGFSDTSKEYKLFRANDAGSIRKALCDW